MDKISATGPNFNSLRTENRVETNTWETIVGILEEHFKQNVGNRNIRGSFNESMRRGQKQHRIGSLKDQWPWKEGNGGVTPGINKAKEPSYRWRERMTDER